MDVAALRLALPNGSYLFSANGSHMALYDDQDVYMRGLIDFLKK